MDMHKTNAPDLNVVILAAGMGTRMKSKLAKVLHRAGGLTLIEHVVDLAARLTTPDRITVVVGHQADKVKSVLADRGVNFAEQTEQKGTAHAVLTCSELLANRPGLLAVLYGDTPLLAEHTLRALVKRQANDDRHGATLITTVLEDPTGYGRVILESSGTVHKIVEQKSATPQELAVRVINSGIYCFRADIFWKYVVEIRPDNPAKEFYLTDIAELLHEAGTPVAGLAIEDPSELLGINTRAELAVADGIFRNRKVRELMLDGVTIERPETVTVDARVKVAADTTIGPFAHLLGKTEIGADCHVGASSIVEDSRIDDRVHILPFTYIASSHVGADAHIGPFARLRMNNEVDAGAHIGNFVELKNTHLGAGAKASHLAYLGDSEIGEKTNIGAGTITCNYDGARKHRTTIGKRAFVGSNSTLVAPVQIGDDSYIGAGSVITDPVPPDALALGRSRQVIKEGWPSRRKRARAVETPANGNQSS